MFDGYGTRMLSVSFLSVFLFELMLFRGVYWPWSASTLSALPPLLFGLAYFSHRVRRDRITIGRLV